MMPLRLHERSVSMMASHGFVEAVPTQPVAAQPMRDKVLQQPLRTTLNYAGIQKLLESHFISFAQQYLATLV